MAGTVRRTPAMLTAVLLLLNTATAGVFPEQTYRIKITFSGYDRAETLTNFPVLVILSTNIPGFRYDSLRAPVTGGDLRFADATRTAALNYEIDSWDTNGSSCIWVQVPALSSSNDCIWALWGSPTYTNPPACTTNGSTWSNDYAGVWHLNSTNDATANRNDGAPTGNPTNVPSAQIAGGYDFDGAGFLSCTNAASLNITRGITISSWVYWRGGRGFVSKEYQGGAGYAAEIDDGGGNIRWYNWGLSGYDMHGTTSFPKDGWHHLALVYDNINGTKNIYFDGSLKDSAVAAGEMTVSADAFYMGFSKLSGDSSLYFNGMLDEMRLSNVARSTNWLWACHENQKAASEFISYEKVRVTDGTVIIIR